VCDGVKVKQGYTDSNGTLTTYYYAGGSYELQTDGSAETVRQYYALAGVTAGMREGTTFSWFLTDHLGSVVGVTDSTGTVVSTTCYSPFGEIRTDVGTVSQTDYGYTFQRNVSGMGLLDYKARYYSNLLGRFVQPDTIIPGAGNPQAWNRYSYTTNNPVNFNDPSGHKACDDYYGRGCKIINPRAPSPNNPVTYINGYTEEQLTNAHQYQGNTPYCGPFSLGIVMSLLTGETVSGNEIDDFLTRKRLKFRNFGIPGKPLTMGANLLFPDYLATYQRNGTIDILKHNVDEGIITMVGVSWQTSFEIIDAIHWGNLEKLTVGHWMVVAGYNDYTNQIILIDPGNTPNQRTHKADFSYYDFDDFQSIFSGQSNMFIGHGDMITFH